MLTSLVHKGPTHGHCRLLASPLWGSLPALVLLALAACSPLAARPPDDTAVARQALIAYFSLLHAGRYAEAAEYYGGSYDVLHAWNPAVAPDDYAALLEQGCTVNGLQCLEIKRVVQAEDLSAGTFRFVVEFANEDGSLFQRGACCRASGAETPPESQFAYSVKKVRDAFLVQELPGYVP